MRALRILALAAIIGLLASSGGAAESRYTLRSGDSLWVVARHFGVSVADLVAANGVPRADLIYAGATIRIPGTPPAPAAGPALGSSPTSYTVKAGDNLTKIAGDHATTVAALLQLNHLRSANVIVIGSKLLLPVGPGPSAGFASPGQLPGRLLASPSRLALRPAFRHWAAVYGVPADLLQAMAWYESGWQNTVVSKTKAVGIGQLMPNTVVFVNQVLLGGTHLDPQKPDDNIRMSARFLRFLLDRTGGKADEALAGYYQGLNSVRARGLYDDTKQYVAGVLSFRPAFR